LRQPSTKTISKTSKPSKKLALAKIKKKEIKGPDNPTSQLLPIMSFKGCSGDGEGRKDKGCGEGSRS
jgi:hypothetical protein